MISLQPGVIMWNIPKEIFIQLQTYLCYWNQVLFVCILSDVILPDLSFGKEEKFREPNSPPPFPTPRRKKIFIKPKTKLMGNGYLS